MRRRTNLTVVLFILAICAPAAGCAGAAALADAETTSPDLASPTADALATNGGKPAGQDAVGQPKVMVGSGAGCAPVGKEAEAGRKAVGGVDAVPKSLVVVPSPRHPKLPRRFDLSQEAPLPRRALHAEAWTLPLPQVERAHPLGDEIRGSVSVGSATQGYLANQKRLPAKGPHLRILQEHQHRNTCWGTDEMVNLLEHSAEVVAKKIPDSILMVGNISQPGGGDMPWSVSHNSGRDVDIAYYVLGPDGKPYQPTTLVALDAKGHGTVDGRLVSFDPARTWAFVKELTSQKAVPVQYVFAYEPLIRAMLEVARKEGLTREQEKALRLVLRQPRGAQPHADHMHVRISCSQEDLSLGCRDIVAGAEVLPRQVAGYQERVAEMLKRVQQKEASPERLSAAWKTLGLLRANVDKRLYTEALSGCLDPLCGALLEASEGLRVSIPPALLVGVVLRSDDVLAVRGAMARMRHEGAAVARAAADLLESTKVLLRDVGPVRDELHVQVEAIHLLGWSGVRAPWVFERLLGFLASDDVRLRRAAAWSLSVLAAGEFLPGAEVEKGPVTDAPQRWKAWHRTHKDPKKNLREALVAKGHKVKGKKALETSDLLKAVELEDCLSMQAQRMLAESFKVAKSPDLLRKREARRYWKSLWSEAGKKKR